MKFKHLFNFYIVLTLVLPGVAVKAQGLEASPAGVMISHNHPLGGWMFGYTYMSTMMQNNLSGIEKVSDQSIFYGNPPYAMSPQTMTMEMHMLMVMYGVTGRLTVMLMTSYNVMNMQMNAFPSARIIEEETATMHSSGFGDVKLYALYKVLNGNGSQLVLSGGVNLPTGNIDVNGNILFPDLRLPYMMQLGTGSFDIMPGITYVKRIRKVSWSAQVLSGLRPFYNTNGYHYGNEVVANVWTAYQFIPALSTSLRLEGYCSGAIQGYDPAIYIGSEPDANPANYGGERVSACFGINYYINKGLLKFSKLQFEYGLPFYQNLNGPQLAAKSALNVAFTIAF